MTDGVRLMAAAFSGLYQVQKDIIHNYFVEVVTKICTWETKVGRDELFGVDILKKLDEKYTVCCVLKMHEPNPFKPYNDTDCRSDVVTVWYSLEIKGKLCRKQFNCHGYRNRCPKSDHYPSSDSGNRV